MSKPRLSELSDEARRILAAEGMGYILHSWGVTLPNGKDQGRGFSAVLEILPDPDQDANEALKLVECLREDRWHVAMNSRDTDPSSEWCCYLSRGVRKTHESFTAYSITLPRALTSAFLLAKGLSTP